MAYGQQGRSGWAFGIPVLGVLAFSVRLLALCGRSGSAPSYNYNLPPPPPKVDLSALLGLDASATKKIDRTEAIAVDATTVYYTDAQDQALYAMPKSGGERRLLTRTSGIVRGIAVGANEVYFTTTSTFGGHESGTVSKVSARGGVALPVVQAGLFVPERIATDGRSVFFTCPNDSSTLSRSVMRATLSGGEIAPLDVDPNAPSSYALVTDESNVYFTSEDGTEVATIPKAGGETKILAPSQLLARDLVADADSLFWIDSLAGKVMKVAKRGGAPTTIASGESDLVGIAVDATSVYWVSQTGGMKLSTIMRGAKIGGVGRAIASGLPGVRNIVSDGTRTYWAAAGNVFWIGANDPAPVVGGAKVNVLGAPSAVARGKLDGGVASLGDAYGAGAETLGGGARGGVIRTFRSKDR